MSEAHTDLADKLNVDALRDALTSLSDNLNCPRGALPGENELKKRNWIDQNLNS
jgi:hypothetical protein